ncbi:MAG: DUF885 domain-containing protein, partial [Thermoanaerobaculia bacterium]
MIHPTCLSRRIFCIAASLFLLASGIKADESTADWVARSEENSSLYLDAWSRFEPEQAGLLGLSGHDTEIFQLPVDRDEQYADAIEQVLTTLRRLEAEEKDPSVRQDLAILIDTGVRDIENTQVQHRLLLPYFVLPKMIFAGIQALLDDQMPEERRAAALVRLRRYTGLETGFTPVTEQAEALIRSRLDETGLLGPGADEVERDLATSPRIIAAIGKLFEQYGPPGYEEPLETLTQQLTAYENFVRLEVLPRARRVPGLPPELYALNLRERGIDMPLGELVSRAKTAFRETQNGMQALAALVAREHELADTDYRQVIRELKKEQLVGDAILSHYQERIIDVERIIRREDIVSLPERALQFRLAGEEESAALPGPALRPPPLIGASESRGEIILPLRLPDAEGTSELEMDDFTFDASSWSLVTHEGRPGHELQLATMAERGVSTARRLFAFNSVNVEGWALYAEAEMLPYLPLDGQLISLQYRLLRAARAFLDPGLQSGEITREEALRILTEDVVLSEVLAQQEVERYVSRSPGQA